MKNRFIPHVLFVLLFTFCFNLNAENLKNIEREEIIKNLCNDWKKYLGDMDFSNEFIFQRLLYLKPQSLGKFKDFEHVKLSKWITTYNGIWIQKHFKGRLRTELLQLKPLKYYLRINEYDESLLFYQTEIDGSTIMILENFTVSLITFRPNDFNSAEGIKKAYLEKILNKWININTDTIPELLKTPIYYKGIVFANNQKRSHILFIESWQDDIICFITEKGVSLLLFKVNEERALKGIPTDPDWLDKNKGLLDK